MLIGLAATAQAQVLVTGRAQSFHYSHEAVLAAANVAAQREYLGFIEDSALSQNWQLQERLDALLKPVVAQARVLRPKLGSLKWRVLLVHDDAYTMASKPNGLITVSENYLRERRFTDAELIFVLAHEVAHVASEHVREILSAVPRHYEPSVPISALRAAELLTEVAYMFEDMEPMYRNLELEADIIGLLIVRYLGIPGSRVLSAFDKMAEAEVGYRSVNDHDDALVRKQKLVRALPWLNVEIQLALVP
jgi:predicted Zn-dependent protease